jgi:hypothetical protein
MRISLLKTLTFLLLIISLLSCTKSRVKKICQDYLNDLIEVGGLSIEYPLKTYAVPVDFQAPTFKWVISSVDHSEWFVA